MPRLLSFSLSLALLLALPLALAHQQPEPAASMGSPAKSAPEEITPGPPPELSTPPVPATPLPILLQPSPLTGLSPAPTVRGLASAPEVIKVLSGLVVLFALAYLGGHPRVRALERRLQVSQVVTAGLPFVFLGVIAHLPAVGILSDSVQWEIRPLLALGLGWIGFALGFRFDSKLADSLVHSVRMTSILTASAPFVTILVLCAVLLVFVEHSPANAIFLRDALILATAGAMTAASAPRLLAVRGGAAHAVDRLSKIVQLEQLAAIIDLMMMAAYFRPQGSIVGWQLPGTAWLFITLGLGTAIGGLVYGALFKTKAGPEFTLMVLGSVSFAAGMAGYLRLSPLVVCFIAGLILVNLPGGPKQQIREALQSMERPIYLLFLLVAGSVWDISAWQGWALMVLFVLARLIGNWLGVLLARKRDPGSLNRDEQRSLQLAPIGALSIAIVVSAADLYFGAAISWIVTAVIGGAVITEIIVQAASALPVEEPHLMGMS